MDDEMRRWEQWRLEPDGEPVPHEADDATEEMLNDWRDEEPSTVSA